MRVLSIEDDPATAQSIELMLKAEGFWVYGTDVMVTVAKNFNVPIKLMFPY